MLEELEEEEAGPAHSASGAGGSSMGVAQVVPMVPVGTAASGLWHWLPFPWPCLQLGAGQAPAPPVTRGQEPVDVPRLSLPLTANFLPV